MARPALLFATIALSISTMAGCPEPAVPVSTTPPAGADAGGALANTPEERRLAVKAAMILQVVDELERVREALGADAARAETLNQRYEALKARVGPAKAEATIAAVRSAKAAEAASREPAQGPLSSLERLTRLEQTAAGLMAPETLEPDDTAAETELKRAVTDQQENLASVLGASRLARQALEHIDELARVVEALEKEAGATR